MGSIAIITARSGSKGVKDKNIKLLNKKPLLSYSIEAAINSGIFDIVHVSTDSEHYASIAKEYGADVPFLRSSETSTDSASSWDVVLEVLERYGEFGLSFDDVTLLQPTSPLREECDIQRAYKLFQEKNANAVVSVCEMEHSPLWSNTLPEDLSMKEFERSEGNMPRQLLPTYYRINGAIYVVKIPLLRKSKNIYCEKCYAYIMDRNKSIDIDTELDFKFAAFLMTND